MEVSCLVLLAMFSGTFAASCENMVRLADLQDIIRNQTKLIADLKNTIAILNTGKIKRSYFIFSRQSARLFHGTALVFQILVD